MGETNEGEFFSLSVPQFPNLPLNLPGVNEAMSHICHIYILTKCDVRYYNSGQGQQKQKFFFFIFFQAAFELIIQGGTPFKSFLHTR